MGQRLVVTVEKNQKELAKIYFHWSAYTVSALYETQKIVDCIYNHEDETEKELQLRLIRFCEKNGGGITGTEEYNEFAYIQNLFPNETFKTDNYSRNDGLIAISEKGMAGLQQWSEGDVIIDLDEDLINFGVYAGYENLDEYNEERMEWDDEYSPLGYEDIPDIGYDLGWIKVEDIGYVSEELDRVNDFVCRNGNEIFEIFA